jgi:multicomponent Na+:H+ antiporter subunit E
VSKTTFPAVISTAVICYIFWLLITGQIVSIFQGDPSVQVLVAGAIVSLLSGLFSARFFIHSEAGYLWNPARIVKLIAYCLVTFPVELIKANMDVATRALSPKLNINPGIVKVPVDVESEYGQAMVANSITLTPGTITMDIVEQDEKTYYYIHWIDVQTEDPEEAGEAIKGKLERGVRGIWK